MMLNVLVPCDHASPPVPPDRFDQVLPINQYAPDRNIRLEVWRVSHWLLDTLEPVARDLLDIAAFVYHADNSVRRGSVNDVFNEDWVRGFTFVIPVRRPKVWQQQSVQSTLVEMLEYLTEDRFQFIFTERERIPEQLAFRAISKALPQCPEADCVTLFSGGMDSLAGAVHLYANGRKPLLVSHQPRSVLVRLQNDLASQLRDRFTSWEFPHLGVWINRIGPRAAENTQRSRSYLFLSLGALVAYQLGIHDLVICENGITTFNLPRLGQITGTLATRSTHPRFIELFRQLIAEVFEVDLRIETPFLWKTKAEVATVLGHNNCGDLIPLSISCARSQGTKMQPHCGVCSQCVDRRFAVAYTQLEATEESSAYLKDVFTGALKEGEERTQAVSVVQFALDARKRDVHSFCEQYVEVYDAVGCLPGDAEQVLQEIYELHRRFADEVVDVMGKKSSENWEEVANRELPDTCLLMLIGSASARRPDWRITERAKELIERLRECPVGQSKALEDICEEVFVFLFCEDLPPGRSLRQPVSQSRTDQEYERRDLLFENRATEGFWADARPEYNAAGIIVDAKNYGSEIDGDVVRGFSSKYLGQSKVGRLGIIVAREIPPDALEAVSLNNRVAAAVKAQKDEWRDYDKMIILLGEDDLVEMMEKKVKGQDPTDLLRARIFTLKSRM